MWCVLTAVNSDFFNINFNHHHHPPMSSQNNHKTSAEVRAQLAELQRWREEEAKAGAVELPPAKKKRATEPEVTEGEFRTRMLAAAERLADVVEFIHHDLQLHTVLLQRNVAMKEAVVAWGDLPQETWVWGRREGTEMQDEDAEWLEAEESEEEGAEEESGKKWKVGRGCRVGSGLSGWKWGVFCFIFVFIL
jgi:hypothetical protein